MDNVINFSSASMIVEVLVQKPWWAYLLWIPAVALLGFAIAGIFAGILHLRRNLFLIPYVGLASLTFYLFLRWSGLPLTELIRDNWLWGVLGAVLVGAFVVRNVFSQPASTRTKGFRLVFDLIWSGAIYGLVDALLLSVLPVLATWQAFSALGWTSNLAGVARSRCHRLRCQPLHHRLLSPGLP